MNERYANLLTDARVARFREIAAQRLNCLTLVFEHLNDPHNISACLRAAESFGLTNAHVISEQARYKCNENISMYADRWLGVNRYDTAADAVSQLREDGYTLIATALCDDSVPLADLELPKRAAILVGNEQDGLSEALIAAADVRLKIPMYGFTQSLNVSAATAVILHDLSNRYREAGDHNLLSSAACDLLVKDWWQRDIQTKTRGYADQEPNAD